MATSEELSPKQEHFCREYLITKNATKSAIAAGYSENSARQLGSQLLSNLNIQRRIRELIEEQMERLEVSADRVLLELAALAFHKPDHFTSWDGKEFKIKPYDNMHPIHKRAIKEIKVVQFDKNVKRSIDEDTGEEVVTKDTETIMSIKFYGKEKPLELLGEHLGLFSQGAEESGDEAMNRALEKLEEEEMKQIEGIED